MLFLTNRKRSKKAMLTNEAILAEDPDSQAIEADEDCDYTPLPDNDSSVVVVEPDMIHLGRKMMKDALRTLPEEQK